MIKERFRIIPTVYLVLMKDDKVLLSRRCNTGYHDGEYSFPAGHIDGNETLILAMLREAKEEAGIKLDPENLKLVHVMHRKTPTEERVNFFFMAEKWEGELKNMEPHKCDDLEWFAVNDLPKNTIPYIRQSLSCVAQKVFYSEYGW